jgi:hypothetical protein
MQCKSADDECKKRASSPPLSCTSKPASKLIAGPKYRRTLFSFVNLPTQILQAIKVFQILELTRLYDLTIQFPRNYRVIRVTKVFVDSFPESIDTTTEFFGVVGGEKFAKVRMGC